MKKTFLLLFLAILPVFYAYCQVTRYWVGGSSTGTFTDGTKWSLSSGGPPIGGTITWGVSDIAKFDSNSGSPTVTFISSFDIGKLHISGNITVTIVNTSTSSRTLFIRSATNDAFTVASGSTLILKGVTDQTKLYLRDYAGLTGHINGTIRVETGSGGGVGELDKGPAATIHFNAGGKYQHHINSGSVPLANWNLNSTIEITGVTTNLPSQMDQNFGHVVWNCTSQSSSINLLDALLTIQGNFSILSTGSSHIQLSNTVSRTMNIGGNFLISSGTFILSDGTANNTMNIYGNFTITGSGSRYYMSTGTGYTTLNVKGNFTMSNSCWGIYQNVSYPNRAQINFNGNTLQLFTKTAGIIYYGINFTINSGAIVDFGTSVLGDPLYSSGNFTLENGASLITSHPQGITLSGSTGCIQVTGTRSFHANAHYHFNSSGTQTSGNGLPATINGSLSIGNATNVTNLSLTNTTTINGSLFIINGGLATANINYGTSGILIYQGTTAQTMGNNEWPSSSVPNVRINNSAGVTMNASKTITTNLHLQSGNLNIGAGNTLSLHNANITQVSGTLIGGSASNMVFSGSGNTFLPGVTNGLNNITINRPGSQINIGGLVNILGTLTMTSGNCYLSGGAITYGVSGILRYNGISAQTTSSAELPASLGPTHLIVDNTVQLNLHANRTFLGNIYLNAGTFSIGDNTLTLHGSIIRTAGTWTGGSNSSLIMSGTGESTNLPGIVLSNLTINRPAGIGLAGNITIFGTVTITTGSINSNGFQLIYQSGASLRYNGQSVQSTNSAELPTVQGPTHLLVDNPTQLTLHENHIFTGNIHLNTGTFTIGNNTLTMSGQFHQGSGTIISAEYGHLIYAENTQQTILPSNANLANLTINRSGGVMMVSNAEIGNLTLTNGNFQIVALTINGSITRLNGNLTGGNNAFLTFWGTGENTGLPPITLNTLVINRPQGIYMLGDVIIRQMLSLISGSFSIGANYLTIEGNINTDEGTLLGGINSHLIIGENLLIFQPFPLPSIELNSLLVNRLMGVNMHGNVIIHSTLNLMNGIFQIGSHQLTLNGELLLNGGQLASNQNSEFTIGGQASVFNLYLTQLAKLELSRPAGLILNNNLTIYNCVNIIRGNINPNGYALIYQTGSTLRYMGTEPQSTTDGEFPDDSGPYDVEILNPHGVQLHASKTIKANLKLINGHLLIGPNTLTIYGDIHYFSGNIIGGYNSSLVITEFEPLPNPLILNEITLANLTINRFAGIELYGNLEIHGLLDLQQGPLLVLNNKLTLHHPITGELDNLWLAPISTLELAGMNAGMNIGANENIRMSQIGHLIISNTHENGICLYNDLYISDTLDVRTASKFIIKQNVHLNMNVFKNLQK